MAHSARTPEGSLGNQSIQISHVAGSIIEIRYEGRTRHVPLRRALVSVSPELRSPARLIRASSGVIPYAVREHLLDELQAWLRSSGPFRACVIGGRGGCGKTRLGVELAERARATNWLAGTLEPRADQEALEALVDAPVSRLVVIDYAETRSEQLEFALPLMAAHATDEHPVRVLLLVRAQPQHANDWRAVLRGRGDELDRLLDAASVLPLEEQALEPSERTTLFAAAAAALAAREGLPIPGSPLALAQPAFGSPLLVVIAAYLAVHDGSDHVPDQRAELLNDLLLHEDHYWRASAGTLANDLILRRRVVALATLAGAANEDEASRLLRLIPDLDDASSERRRVLARWAAGLYPGDAYWNPLEPDILGEHLVACTYADNPGVLGGVLDRERARAAVQPLTLYARAAADDARLAIALGPLLSTRLGALCDQAMQEAMAERDLDRILGDMTLGAALHRAIRVIPVSTAGLSAAVPMLPLRDDLVLDELVLTVARQLADRYRELDDGDPERGSLAMAKALYNLSTALSRTGRDRREALAPLEEAISMLRVLAAQDVAVERDLALALNVAAPDLAAAGRRDDALAAIDEAVRLRRHHAETNGSEPDWRVLLFSLRTQSNQLATLGRPADGLSVIEEAVALYPQHARRGDGDPRDPLWTALMVALSARLVEVGRPEEALSAMEEAIWWLRELAAWIPAGFTTTLADMLTVLAEQHVNLGRREDGIAALAEAVAIYRRLASGNPQAHKRTLRMYLHDLADQLALAGRRDEAHRIWDEAGGCPYSGSSS